MPPIDFPRPVASVLDLHDPSAQAYLRGDTFSNGQRFRFALSPRPVRRLDLLRRMATGKRVLHLGFADHLPLIDAKIAKGTWLHALLADVAASVTGIDNDAEAVAHCRALGYGDLHTLDVTTDALPADLDGQTWDLAVLGEILEHVDNPVAFLDGLRRTLDGRCAEIVISTPNAFEASNLVHAMRSVEFINTDHRFWWTPYTLAKVCTRAGLTVVDLDVCKNHRSSVLAMEPLTHLFPMLRDTLVVRCRL